MTADAEGRFEPRRPLDLRRSLNLLGYGPWARREDGAVWFATRTREGPATLHLARRNGTVDVRAWGPGAAWAAAHAPALCGEEDDDSGFDPTHPVLARLHRESRGLRMPRTHAVFEALLPTVIGQQVTSEEAHESYRHLVNALGEPAPGPRRLTLPPDPHSLANTPYWAFHRFGIERRRADVIIRAARSVKRLEETVTMDLPSAYRRLQAFPGVGPWTAKIYLLMALRRPDIWPDGDVALATAFGRLRKMKARPTFIELAKFAERWRPYRSVAARMLWQYYLAERNGKSRDASPTSRSSMAPWPHGRR